MKCFGKNNKSFAKPTKKNLIDDIADVDCPSTTSQRAAFRKSKLTNNTDSGLYSDESGPEDRPRKINQDKLKINSAESYSSSSTPNSLLDSHTRFSHAKVQVPDSWYHQSSSPNNNHEQGVVSSASQNIEHTHIKSQNDLDLESPKSIKKLLKFRGTGLNYSDKIQMLDLNSQKSKDDKGLKNLKSTRDINENHLAIESKNDPTSENNCTKYSEFGTLKSPVVKINREAFNRLNNEYLSEYDSEDEMEKTLAECIALDEMKKQKLRINYDSSNDSNRSSLSSTKLADDNKLCEGEIPIHCAPETLYAEVIKKPKIDTKRANLNELVINEPLNENFHSHIQRQKTLHSLHRFLDQVDTFMNKDKKFFKKGQIEAMKDRCKILTDNLSIFEKLGINAMQNDEKELSSKEHVKRCIMSLNLIKKHILNYSNLIGNLSSNQNPEESFSTSVAAILNHTKNIPDLIRTLDYSISKNRESKPIDNIKSTLKNNNALLVFDHEDIKDREKHDLKKSTKPIDLDLVQNINDNHIYDEVAEEPTSPNSKAILNELNFMIAELTSSTPIKNDKNNRQEGKLNNDLKFDRISPIAIISNEECNNISKILDTDKKLNMHNMTPEINHPSKMQYNHENTYTINKEINLSDRSEKGFHSLKAQNQTSFNGNNSIRNLENHASLKNMEKGMNHSTASLFDLETKFANMLNILSSSKDALPKQDQGSKQFNKSLNDLKEINKKKEITESTNDESISIQLLKSIDLDKASGSTLNIFSNSAISNTPMMEKQSSKNSIDYSIQSDLTNKAIKANTNVRDINKHLEIVNSLKVQLEYKKITLFNVNSATKSGQQNFPNYELSNKMNFYTLEMTEHWKVLIQMSDAFFDFIEQLNNSKDTNDLAGSQGPSLLMSYVKLIIQAGQKIVQIADMFLDDISDATMSSKIDTLSESLCIALKDIVQRTKDATNYFHSIPCLQSLVDSVKTVADRAGDMRVALNTIRLQNS